jgi:hypothetical protein
LFEGAGIGSALHNVPRRLTAVGWVGKDVVNHQDSIGNEVRSELFVIVLRYFFGVIAVEEEELQWRRPPRSDSLS